MITVEGPFDISTDSISIPLYHAGVAAGNPAYVSQFFEETIDIARHAVNNPKTSFCVRVNGQSMIKAGIDDGDLLIVDKSLHADNNQIVLAVINGEFTVKRLLKKGNRVFLLPENPDFDPIEITEFMDFRISGVVTGVIKKMIP